MEFARDSPISSYESKENIFNLNAESAFKIEITLGLRNSEKAATKSCGVLDSLF